ALDDFKVMVFPFIEGHNAYETHLLDRHWVELGQALKALHTANLSVKNHIQRECYTDHWRQQVRQFQRLTEEKLFDDPVAAELAAFLKQKKAVVDDLIHRAERLAAVLRSEPLPFTLCHADIHAGNVLIDLHQHLYLIDWDTLILAPKERDLMFVGAGLFLNQRSTEEETRLFYQGYGQTEVNSDALAYYRYERIVQDIAAYCEQLLLTTEGGQDRENGLRQLMSQFQPGGVVEMAFK
ncbi:MAG: aminoglycoside phosphotransferase family protein, partial [Anaerolineae bacterium]|nr:aminoglycoside phosphotransferase family protein [Anaerolineae bacterium]